MPQACTFAMACDEQNNHSGYKVHGNQASLGLKDIFSRFFNKEVMLMLTLTLTPTTTSATPKSQNLEAPLGCRNSRNTRFISGSN